MSVDGHHESELLDHQHYQHHHRDHLHKHIAFSSSAMLAIPQLTRDATVNQIKQLMVAEIVPA